MAHAATVYFLDVGQGSSQVIQLDDGSLVIIDCGRSAVPLLEFLDSISFNRITALILSHLHSDHASGAIALLDAHSDRIDHVYIPLDRAPKDLLANHVIRTLDKLEQAGSPINIEVLVYHGTVDGRLHPPLPENSRCKLRILYPNIMQTLHAQEQPDPNQGSCILMLECGEHRILFPADAGKMAFERMRLRLAAPNLLSFDVIAAPHHGGKLTNSPKDYPGYNNAFSWLFTEVLQTKFVIFSVGSSNDYGHPLPEHIDAVRATRGQVLCTQLTNQCHPNPNQVSDRSLIPVLYPSACSTKGIGCAGTIVALMDETTVEIARFDAHQQSVDTLSQSQTISPLCRRVPSREPSNYPTF